MLPIALVGYAWVIIVVAFVLFIGLVVGVYTRGGSGIEPHPRGPRRGGLAPGAYGRSETSARDEGEHVDVQRGTR